MLEEIAQAQLKARIEPVWFAEEILQVRKMDGDSLDWSLDVWQKEFVEAVSDAYRFQNDLPTVINHKGKKKFTIRAMHGPGKTFSVAMLMHWFNFCFRGTIVCTAPKEKQLKTRLWPTFRKISNRAIDGYDKLIDIRTTEITWCNEADWAAYAETASVPENLAGYHADYLLFIVDEASGLREEMFPVIEGAISTGKFVIIVLIGNPTKVNGTFFDSHHTIESYYRIHVELDKTTRVSREWVEDMRKRYGSNSPIFKVRCLGEFADTEKDQLIPIGWMDNARNRDYVDFGLHDSLRVSVDVGDGIDETVITVSRQNSENILMLKQYVFSFPSSESPVMAAETAIKIFNEWGGKKNTYDDFVIDSLGVGAGTAGTLIRKGYNVVTYKGGESSDDPTQWRNRRVQSYIALRDSLRDGRIVFDDDFCSDENWDTLVNQVIAIKSKPGIGKTEDIETKSDLVKRIGVSPDRADSLAMQYATQLPVGININTIGADTFGTMESASGF